MYLLNSTEKYRVETVAEVEALHEELAKDVNFTLVGFSYQTKYIKEKGEIVGEYQLVTAKKTFNSEKEPDRSVYISYEV